MCFKKCNLLVSLCIFCVFFEGLLMAPCEQFLVVTHDGVSLHSATGGHKQLALLKDMVKDVDYHYDRGELYVLTYRQIARCPLQGPPSCDLQPLVDPEDEYLLTALAVDWEHAFLYWLSGAVLTLHRSLLDGSDPRVLYRGLYIEQHLNKLFVDPYAGLLFWMTNNEVHSSNLEGGDVRRNVFYGISSVRNMALDPADRRVYLLAADGQDSWNVVSCDYDGGDLQKLASSPSVIYGLGGLHGCAYWIPHEEDSCVWIGNDDYRYSFSIYTSDENRTKPSTVLSISEHVWNLRLYHKDLQSQNVKILTSNV